MAAYGDVTDHDMCAYHCRKTAGCVAIIMHILTCYLKSVCDPLQVANETEVHIKTASKYKFGLTIMLTYYTNSVFCFCVAFIYQLH